MRAVIILLLLLLSCNKKVVKIDIPEVPKFTDGVIMVLPGEPQKHENMVVYFDYDNGELKESEIQKLEGFNFDNASVSIVGYASEEGAEDYNLKLSAKRAVSVYDFIGVNYRSTEINMLYKGETERFGTGKENYHLNRVVTLDVLYE